MANDGQSGAVSSAMMGGVLSSIQNIALNAALAPLVRLQRRRVEDAFGLMLEELRLGGISPEEFERDAGTGAAALRLLQCAAEGAARRNLRMMARYIRNAHSGPPDRKEEFQRWAPLLASLSPEEIAVLGVMHRCMTSALAEHPLDKAQQISAAYTAAMEELVGNGRVLGPSVETLDGVLNGLTRTGLVMIEFAFGRLHFRPTASLGKLVQLIQFEEFADEILAD